MKEFDISQMPILNEEGKIAGLVTEVDLLEHMVSGEHIPNPAETIASIIQPKPPSYPAHTPLENVIPDLLAGSVILVSESKNPIGVLTKIDVLDIVSQDTQIEYSTKKT